MGIMTGTAALGHDRVHKQFPIGFMLMTQIAKGTLFHRQHSGLLLGMGVMAGAAALLQDGVNRDRSAGDDIVTHVTEGRIVLVEKLVMA